ncbi:MAG: ChrR family anti-sigma-E factor [Rhodospirillaceae bacterium]
MMIRPSHHPAEEFLLDYADGSLGEASALVIATHLALCPDCRNKVADLEAIGGALLDAERLEPVSMPCLDAMMARLGEPQPLTRREKPPQLTALPPDILMIPEPLRGYIGAPLSSLGWRQLRPGIEDVDLGIGQAPAQTRLFRIMPGVVTPRHGHCGTEMALVLAGGYRDEQGNCCRGDVFIYDSTVEHSPVADHGEPCLCLVVTDAPLLFMDD